MCIRALVFGRDDHQCWTHYMKSSETDDPSGRDEDDPLQALIGLQLRSLYDSVLAEPIPDRLTELLAKLDDIPAPTKSGDDTSGAGSL